MLRKVTDFFDQLMRKYTPDPYIFAVLLTFVVMGASLILTGSSPAKVVRAWGDGFWSILSFTMQMVLVLMGGYVVALSGPIRHGLESVVRLVRTPGQAVVITTLISALANLLNWGLGLIVGAIVAVEMARHVRNVNFRILVASAYSGFLVWHGGFSGSIPLLVNTPGNFSEKWIGSTIPLSQTLFSPLNGTIVIVLLFAMPALNFLLYRGASGREPISKVDSKSLDASAAHEAATKSDSLPKTMPQTTAERLESSWVLAFMTGGVGLLYIVLQIYSGQFQLDLNSVNFIFLFAAILLHRRPRAFLDAIIRAAEKTGPIIIQYPFYAGIMGIMTSTGLAEVISNWFVSISTAQTFPLLTFYSAGFLNIFIPSGGGQWAVQGPIVVPAAQALGANMSQSIMAVAWGDAWTNLIQPFWTLPLLAIAGLKARDIMGYCVIMTVISGAIISLIFLMSST